MDPVLAITSSLNTLLIEMLSTLPLVIVAIIIWLVGDWLLKFAIKLLKKMDVKGTKLDDKIIHHLSMVILWLGKFLLVLIVLDYLGIGRTVVGAIANGLVFSVAIAIGLAFGKALEPEARMVVDETKKLLGW